MIILDFYGVTGGVGRALREIMRELGRREARVVYAGMEGLVSRFNPEAHGLRKVKLWPLNRPRGSLPYFKLLFYRKFCREASGYGDVLLSEARKRAGGQFKGTRIMVNFPHFTPPPSRESGYAVLIHDLNWIHYPGNFTLPKRADAWCRAWVKRAGIVIANSEFTRDEIIQHYGCSAEKVVAAPFAPFAESARGPEERVLSRFGVEPGRYFLFPTVWGTHKGLDLLTEAIERAPNADPVIVTCGAPLDGIESDHAGIAAVRRQLNPRWEKLCAEKRLITVMDLPEGEMQALRDHCKAFVLPTRFEGFGFPAAEAVYNYRAAIMSDIPAHREILARYPQYDLATVFAPDSPEALAEALLKPFPYHNAPVRWAQDIDDSWSWKNTVDRILSAVRVG